MQKTLCLSSTLKKSHEIEISVKNKRTTIPVFVSDRHRGICKYIRNSHPAIKHFFDQWHVIKGIVKKCSKQAKKRDVKR